MLFDLRSPGRRNLIKVVYAGLAVLLGGGLIFFGIGGSGGGLLSDVGGGGGGGGGNPFEDQIDDAEAKLQQNPQDQAALAELVQLNYQAGSNQIQVDQETGEQSLTEDGEQRLREAADAWDRYLRVTQKTGAKADTGTALVAFQLFSLLGNVSFSEARGSTSLTDALAKGNDATTSWSDAAEAQRVVADAQPTAASYVRLASLLYLAGDPAGGDQAAAQGRQVAKPNETEALEQQLKQAKKQGEQLATALAELEKQQEKTSQATGGASGANPLEALGGGGLGSGGGLSGQ
jgi:hypothetical protein